MNRRNGFGSRERGERHVKNLRDRYEDLAAYPCYLSMIETKNLIERNIPDKVENLKKPITAAATERIETGQLPEICRAIERLLVHEIDGHSPVCERCTVKRDFKNIEGGVFCITKYRTPFPEEIKKIEEYIVDLFSDLYNLKLRFGSLT